MYYETSFVLAREPLAYFLAYARIPTPNARIYGI